MPDDEVRAAHDHMNAVLRGQEVSPIGESLPAEVSAVARAAHARGFRDPTEAEAFLAGREFETDAEAEQAVAELAGRKAYLLGEAHQPPPPLLPGSFGGGIRGGYRRVPESPDDAIRRALREARSAPGEAEIDFGRSGPLTWGS